MVKSDLDCKKSPAGTPQDARGACPKRKSAQKDAVSPKTEYGSSQNHASTLPQKQALTRKDIRAEYGWSERATARLEKRGILVASKIFRKRFYLRSDVEACLRNNK
jgi:hypothetical protein